MLALLIDMKLTTLSMVLVAAAGCGSQVDSDHQGEVLATLNGSMNSTEVPSPTRASVAVVWAIGSAGTKMAGADFVDVEGSLPSNFTLDIFTPPADEFMREVDGLAFGAAFIAAVRTDQDPKLWQQWLGVENDHVLVYLPETPPKDSTLAALLHGEPTKGFHIYRRYRPTEAERDARTQCMAMTGGDLNKIYRVCGGDNSNDDLLPTDLDVETLLSITLVIQFGLDEFNAMPRWWGLV